MKIEMDVNVLLGMENFVSTDQTRYNLTGVCFDGDKLIATDGHVLTRVKLGGRYRADITEGDSFVLELSKDVLGFLKNNKGNKMMVQHDNGTVKLLCNGTTMETKAIDMSFPSWEQVVPDNDDKRTDEIALNPKLITKFEKFHKLNNGRGDVCLKFDFGDDDLSPVKIRLSSIPEDDFIGVIMPMRV